MTDLQRVLSRELKIGRDEIPSVRLRRAFHRSAVRAHRDDAVPEVRLVRRGRFLAMRPFDDERVRDKEPSELLHRMYPHAKTSERVGARALVRARPDAARRGHTL